MDVLKAIGGHLADRFWTVHRHHIRTSTLADRGDEIALIRQERHGPGRFIYIGIRQSEGQSHSCQASIPVSEDGNLQRAANFRAKE